MSQLCKDSTCKRLNDPNRAKTLTNNEWLSRVDVTAFKHSGSVSLTSAAAGAGSLDSTYTDLRWSSSGALFWFNESTSEKHKPTWESSPSFLRTHGWTVSLPWPRVNCYTSQLALTHLPCGLEAVGGSLTECRGAARGLSLESSRCTRFSKL